MTRNGWIVGSTILGFAIALLITPDFSDQVRHRLNGYGACAVIGFSFLILSTICVLVWQRLRTSLWLFLEVVLAFSLVCFMYLNYRASVLELNERGLWIESLQREAQEDWQSGYMGEREKKVSSTVLVDEEKKRCQVPFWWTISLGAWWASAPTPASGAGVLTLAPGVTLPPQAPDFLLNE